MQSFKKFLIASIAILILSPIPWTAYGFSDRPDWIHLFSKSPSSKPPALQKPATNTIAPSGGTPGAQTIVPAANLGGDGDWCTSDQDCSSGNCGEERRCLPSKTMIRELSNPKITNSAPLMNQTVIPNAPIYVTFDRAMKPTTAGAISLWFLCIHLSDCPTSYPLASVDNISVSRSTSDPKTFTISLPTNQPLLKAGFQYLLKVDKDGARDLDDSPLEINFASLFTVVGCSPAWQFDQAGVFSHAICQNPNDPHNYICHLDASVEADLCPGSNLTAYIDTYYECRGNKRDGTYGITPDGFRRSMPLPDGIKCKEGFQEDRSSGELQCGDYSTYGWQGANDYYACTKPAQPTGDNLSPQQKSFAGGSVCCSY